MNTEMRKRLRRKIIAMSTRLPSPFCDSSSSKIWSEEIEVCLRLLDGQELCQTRHYIDAQETYGISWQWSVYPKYPPQWDGPVDNLMSRGAIRSTRVAGGYTKMIFTEAAQKMLGPRAVEQAAWRMMGFNVEFSDEKAAAKS